MVVAIGLFCIRFDLTNDRRMKETIKSLRLHLYLTLAQFLKLKHSRMLHNVENL